MGIAVYEKVLLTLITFLLWSLFTAVSHADDSLSCQLIEEEAERLQCYDNLATQISENQVLLQRSKLEDASQLNPFSITPYRPNYVLPVSYNTSPNTVPFEQIIEPGASMDNLEIKFQISFEVDIFRDIQQSELDPVRYC